MSEATILSETGPDAAAQAPVGALPARLWKRILAFGIDYALLGAFIFLAGLAFFDQLAALGQWGRLLGLALYLGYFTALDSGGRITLGKRLLGIKVVDAHARPLSPGKAGLRAFIFGLPIFLNGLWLPPGPGSEALALTAAFGFIGLELVLLYLFLFNRKSRQSLHDLATGAYVIPAKAQVAPVAPLWRGHLAIVGGLAALVVALLASVQDMVKAQLGSELDAMQAVVTDLYTRGLISQGSVSKQTSLGEEKNGTSTVIVLVSPTRPRDPETLARTAVDKAAEHPGLMAVDYVVAKVVYGYQTGIFHSEETVTISRTPKEWLNPGENATTPGS